MLARDPRDSVGDAMAFPAGSSSVRGKIPCLDLGGVVAAWVVSGLLSWVVVTAVVGLLRWAIR